LTWRAYPNFIHGFGEEVIENPEKPIEHDDAWNFYIAKYEIIFNG